jgi:flavin reductase (DIM6/NTAB) family NADH-FMN oxidoreductase RutF
MHPVHSRQLDDSTLRRVFGCFPSGVIAVCASIDGEPVGMAASSFTTVSVAPPLVSICVQNTSTTWPRLRECERLGVSVLAEHHSDPWDKDYVYIAPGTRNRDSFDIMSYGPDGVDGGGDDIGNWK